MTAALMALHGARKGSLSLSGAIAAFTVGYISLANPVRAFGITLLTFYILGSRATKIGHKLKATLETDISSPVRKSKKINTDHAASSGGKRDAWQVLCNSALSAVCAGLFRLLYDDNRKWQDGTAWCLFDGAPKSASANLLNRIQRASGSSVSHLIDASTPQILFLLMLGHFACCMGDTLASELGILAKTWPRLILPPFTSVPPGTNGGLSVQGTLGSLAGGTLIGITAGTVCVLLDNPACSDRTIEIITKLALLGALGGIGGSAIDSVLGATLQRTWYNKDRKQVLLGRLPASLARSSEWRRITGYDILSNNWVNFVSSTLTAILIAYVGSQYVFWR